MPLSKIQAEILRLLTHVVQPDPGRLHEYQTPAGKNRGHWPGSPEIADAMLERYQEEPDENSP